MRRLIVCCLISTLSVGASAQEPAKPPQRPPQAETLKIGSEEVLLDVVVRDKRGKAVQDLKPEEIEVYEDGARQSLTSFRAINKDAAASSGESAAGNRSSGNSSPVNSSPGNNPAPALDPLRQINLVTLVFERLGSDGRKFAREAALEFLNTELGPNTMVAVFTLDQRLRALQPFSSNRERLKQAVEQATGGTAYSKFGSEAEGLRREAENQERAQSLAEGATANVGPGGVQGNPGGSFADAKAAEVMINTMRMVDDLQRTQQGSSSVYSMMALIAGQRGLAGRKTVLYFSEGLQIPPNLVDAFHAAISAANRANVSVYAVDARGLTTARETDAARESLDAAVRASAQQMRTRGGQAVTPEQIKGFDNAEAAIRKNGQNSLAELAESTGGALIANTNDFRTPMRRVLSELNTYYELSYSPAAREYDGKFRSLSVKVTRPGVVVQTRSGYFALPPVEGTPLLPYEMPMLGALGALPLPRDFEHRAVALHFSQNPEGTQHTLILEAPLGNFHFTTDEQKKVYETHFALLALIKNSDGRIVQRFSEDYPLSGPLSSLAGRKQGNAVFIRNFTLAPGRYTLETVAYDRETHRRSARRSILVVPASRAGLRLSSLSVVKRLDPVERGEQENPLVIEDRRIVPNLNEPIRPVAGGSLLLYLTIYPAAAADAPQLTIEFLQDGKAVARTAPEVKGDGKGGRIPYLATVPSDSFKPGTYEVRAVVRQGGQAAEEHAFFTIGQ